MGKLFGLMFLIMAALIVWAARGEAEEPYDDRPGTVSILYYKSHGSIISGYMMDVVMAHDNSVVKLTIDHATYRRMAAGDKVVLRYKLGKLVFWYRVL